MQVGLAAVAEKEPGAHSAHAASRDALPISPEAR